MEWVEILTKKKIYSRIGSDYASLADWEGIISREWRRKSECVRFTREVLTLEFNPSLNFKARYPKWSRKQF